MIKMDIGACTGVPQTHFYWSTSTEETNVQEHVKLAGKYNDIYNIGA